MPEEPDYYLDIRGLTEPAEGASSAGDEAGMDARKWIGVQFECCGVYVRVYRNREGSAYEGYCPRCARPVRVCIGAGGTSHRMFIAK